MMRDAIRIYSKDEKFTLSDLSELCYNINNVYKLIIFDREKKENIKYYYRNKLSDKDSLFVEKVSKQSPFFLEIASEVVGIIGVIVGIINISISLRRRPIDRREVKEVVRHELREFNIRISEELVNEVIRLSKRRIKIEEVERGE